LTPGVATDPATGNYCLIMPCRFTEVAKEEVVENKVIAPAIAA
jgi:hypothetical protein